MSFIELVAWSVWDYVRPRKIATIILVGLAGPFFATLLRTTVPPDEYGPEIAYGLTVPTSVYSFALVLLSVVFASGIVSSEMVGKTIQYLLTRPTPRWKIFLAKWLAAVIVVSVAVMISCTVTAMITHGPANLANSKLSRDLFIIPIGAVAYCSLFALLSVLSTKPWIFAISFGFLWESWVPLVPGDFQKLSVMAHLRALSPQVQVNNTQGPEEILRRLSGGEVISPSTAWNALLLITILSLAIAAAVFSSAEFVPRDEAV